MTRKGSRAPGAYRGEANDIFPAISQGASQIIAYTGAAAQSAAFATGVTILRVFATTDCFLEFGANPTATSGSMFLPGGFIEYFEVRPGDKLSVIRSTISGTLYMTEGAI